MICRKCGKKISGGFGPRQRTRLDKALRDALGSGKGRRGTLGLMQIGCLDICPKNAVTVALGSTPDTLYVIRKGTPIDEVVDILGLRSPEEKAAEGEGTGTEAGAGASPPAP